MHIFLLSTNSSCCSIFKDQVLTSLSASRGQLDYYSTSLFACQGVSQKFFKFFQLSFQNRLTRQSCVRCRSFSNFCIISHLFSFVKRFLKSFWSFFNLSSNRSANSSRDYCCLLSNFCIIAHLFFFVKRFFKSFSIFFRTFSSNRSINPIRAFRFGFPSTACIVYHTTLRLSTPFGKIFRLW